MPTVTRGRPSATKTTGQQAARTTSQAQMAQQKRSGTATGPLWKGQWVAEQYALINAGNQYGFDVQINLFEAGQTQTQLLSDLCPQAMRILQQLFSDYGVLASSAGHNRAVVSPDTAGGPNTALSTTGTGGTTTSSPPKVTASSARKTAS